MTFSSTIPFKPFSKKQRDYILAAEKNTFNFAEGAVRSGKTVCNVVAFALALNKTPDRLHLATGVTLAAACLNIGDCNGFGLEHLFRGRCRWGKYRNNTCLYIKCDSGEKVVIFAGGGKSDSYKKIRGNSYGMWIATEINKHYLSPGEDSFIKEAFNRQLAAANRKVFWDLNPDYPTHPVYTEYIDKYRTLGMDVNYRLFTMKDNLAISEKRRLEIERQYDKDSVWYKRSVLGQRIAAEGLIFGAFAVTFTVLMSWPKLVKDFGPIGGFMAAALIIGTFWLVNHKLPGFGFSTGLLNDADGLPMQFSLIHQGNRGSAPWVDMGWAIAMGFIFADVLCAPKGTRGGLLKEAFPRWVVIILGGIVGGIFVGLTGYTNAAL